MQASSYISNIKKYTARILRIAVILFVIIFIFSKIISVSSAGTYRNGIKALDNLGQDTVDVLCIGSSHIHCGINPVQLYDDYGITAYDLSNGGLRFSVGYYYLKEALKRQKPKTVIIGIYEDFDYSDADRPFAIMDTINLPFSIDKWRAINTTNLTDVNDRIGTMFVFPIAHVLYNDLGKNLKSGVLNAADENLGYYLEVGHIDSDRSNYDYSKVAAITETTPIPEICEEYLRKSIELCLDNDIKVVLVNAPCWSITEDEQKYFNYMYEMADEYGISYIDGVDKSGEIGIDYKTDFFDENGHLNYSGVSKFTEYIYESELKSENLEDHRGDTKYSKYDDAVVNFEQDYERLSQAEQ